MLSKIPTISQDGISALLKERLEHPDLYIDRPLIIWRSDFRDGIQLDLLLDALREYNTTKPLEDKKWYRETMLGDISQVGPELTEEEVRDEEAPSNSRIGIYVVSPIFAPMDYGMDKASINDYIEALTARKFKGVKMRPGIPVVAYMCYNYDWFETPDAYRGAEQYVFEPDFEQWCRRVEKTSGSIKKVIDFIRGYRDAEGILYCWYNFFNNSKGCYFPDWWDHAIGNLKMKLKVARLKKFSEIPEDDFKRAFGQGISKDIVDKFYIYVKERNL